VKRITLRPRWLVIALIILLALTACERPIPREETPETPETVAPTTEPFVIPTPIPTVESEATAPATPGAGEQVGGDAEGQLPADQQGGEGSASSGETTEPQGDTLGAPTSYTVQSGDTLGAIAERYDVSIEEIAAANNIINIHSLDVGQVLVIPAPGSEITPPESEQATPEPESGERTHVVKAGENLFRIGLVYGFTADELAAYNNLVDPSRLDVGQVLRIPPEQ